MCVYARMINTENYSVENLSRVLKALSDVNRLNIVLSIGKKACSVSEIIKATALSQTLVSFHLRALREADIVTTQGKGPFVLYNLSGPDINKTLIRLAKSIKLNGRKVGLTLQGNGNKRRSVA